MPAQIERESVLLQNRRTDSGEGSYCPFLWKGGGGGGVSPCSVLEANVAQKLYVHHPHAVVLSRQQHRSRQGLGKPYHVVKKVWSARLGIPSLLRLQQKGPIGRLTGGIQLQGRLCCQRN